MLGIPSASACADLGASAVAPATCVWTQPWCPVPGIPGAPVICKTNKSCAQLLPPWPHRPPGRAGGAASVHRTSADSRAGLLSPGGVSGRPSTFVLHAPRAGHLPPAKRQANENPRIDARKMTIPTPPGKEASTLPPREEGPSAFNSLHSVFFRGVRPAARGRLINLAVTSH